jgi:hypothetical protein
MGWRGFGFGHHSRTIFCRAVPNPNLTIRNFFIARAHVPPAFRPQARADAARGELKRRRGTRQADTQGVETKRTEVRVIFTGTRRR